MSLTLDRVLKGNESGDKIERWWRVVKKKKKKKEGRRERWEEIVVYKTRATRIAGRFRARGLGCAWPGDARGGR